MFDIISIGSATLDVFLRAKGLEVEKQDGAKEICVPYGAKINVEEIHFESGGGGTNSAVTFARQGLKTASIIKIGDDFAGKKVKRDLEGEEVNSSLIVEEKGGYTDYSTILWAPDGGRTVLVYRGKSKLEVEEIPWERLKSKWFYISSVEGNLEIIKKIQKFKGFKGLKGLIKIAWNPGGKELEQREKALALLPAIEVLNLNKEEMEKLLKMEDGRWKMEELLSEAQNLPCRYVVITNERNGSYLWNGKIWLHAGIYKDAPRIEATGAGDAFGSGLVSGLIKGFSLENCLRLASANASSVVGKVGAKKGILHKREVKTWMSKKLNIQELT